MKTTTAKMLLTAILLAAIVLGSAKAKKTDERRERLFAYYSTTSVTRLTTTTITGLETCLSTAQTLVPEVKNAAGDMVIVALTPRAPDCQGRRKRTLPRPIEADLIDLQVDGSELEGTLDETFEAHEMEKREVPARDGKFLTIWSTNFNVITITSTSILPLTTITMKTAPAKMLLTAVLVWTIIVLASAKVDKDDQRAERLFAYYSTTSVTRLTTTTITGLATCFSTAAATPPPRSPDCQGRRKRTISQEVEADSDELLLDGSLVDESEVLAVEKREVPVRSDKQLIIWSTQFTVITITSTSTLPLTTITIRAACFFPGNANTCF